MGKRETKHATRDVVNDQNQTRSNYDNVQGQNDQDIRDRNSAVSESRQPLVDNYTGLLRTNSSINPGRIFGGNVSTSRLSDIGSRYKGFSDTGGYDDTRRSSIMDQVNDLKSFGRTGGLDANAVNRMRGKGVFDEFAVTGGLSDKDRGNIRAKALSPISSYATATGDELARRRSVQGGYAPGFDAASRALRRDTARGIADTSLDAELGIRDRVNAGRQWGAGNIASSEGGIQSLKTGNMFRGMTSAADTEMRLQDTINNYMLAGLSGEEAIARSIADIDTGNINRQIGVDTYNNNTRLGQENSDRDYNTNVRFRGLSGLEGLYNTDVGLAEGARDRRLNILSGGVGANLGYYGQRNPLATQPGIGGNLLNLAGAASGAAAGYFTGQGGRRGMTSPQNLPIFQAGTMGF